MDFNLKMDIDLKPLKKLEKQVKALNRRHIKFGWIEGKNYPASSGNSGISYAQVANWQEYGLAGSGDRPSIPARPYFRQTINRVRYKYNSDIRDIFTTALQGSNTLPKLERISSGVIFDYNESVARQNHKKLSAYTMKLKGHGYQMIDSGLMNKNFKAKVYRVKLS